MFARNCSDAREYVRKRMKRFTGEEAFKNTIGVFKAEHNRAEALETRNFDIEQRLIAEIKGHFKKFQDAFEESVDEIWYTFENSGSSE